MPYSFDISKTFFQICWNAGIDVGVALATGRVGVTLGNNIKIGLNGEALGAGAKFWTKFDNGELKFIGGGTLIVRGRVYVRITFWWG